MARALGLILVLLFAAMPRDAHASARELAGQCQTLLKGKHGHGEQIRIPLSKPALTCWGYMQAVQDFATLADESGHPPTAGHHVVIVTCRLANHVYDGGAALVMD